VVESGPGDNIGVVEATDKRDGGFPEEDWEITLLIVLVPVIANPRLRARFADAVVASSMPYQL
jgi:hypothetical protein